MGVLYRMRAVLEENEKKNRIFFAQTQIAAQRPSQNRKRQRGHCDTLSFVRELKNKTHTRERAPAGCCHTFYVLSRLQNVRVWVLDRCMCVCGFARAASCRVYFTVNEWKWMAGFSSCSKFVIILFPFPVSAHRIALTISTALLHRFHAARLTITVCSISKRNLWLLARQLDDASCTHTRTASPTTHSSFRIWLAALV